MRTAFSRPVAKPVSTESTHVLVIPAGGHTGLHVRRPWSSVARGSDVELIVIIKVGGVIGFWPTLALLIVVSIAGTMLLKREGMATWRRLQAALQRGEMPTEEVSDGALILFGGALLLTPGFVTDIVGLAMIFPPTRVVVKGAGRKLVGVAALKRFPGATSAYTASRNVYQGRVTDSRRVRSTNSTPGQLPSVPPGPSDEGDSRDTR